MSVKHAVITGASTGIGAETARILKNREWRITALDIAETTANVDDYLQVDMSDKASVDKALSSLSEPIDALLNIAGIPPREDNADKVLCVNWVGLRYLTEGLLDRMASSSSIVNMASRAGAEWRNNIEQVKACMDITEFEHVNDFINQQSIDPVRAYNLSKEAVIVWTMAKSGSLMSKNIRVNSVSPAAVSTDIIADFDTAFGDRTTHYRAYVGRNGQASEIAEVVAFLSSRESNWIKGTDLIVDGGMYAHQNSQMLEIDDS